MNKVALVTGAVGGFGVAICDVLASRGWALVLSDLNEGALETVTDKLVASYPALECTAIAADLAIPSDIQALVEAAVAWRGRIDCLVNNAALPSRARLQDISVSEWDQVMQINLRAPMLLMQRLKPVFEQQGTGGSIVNVASRVWATGGPVAYVAAKAGLVGLTRVAAFDMGPLGVRVNAIAPSAVATRFTAQSRSVEEMHQFQERQRNLSVLKREPEIREIATSVAFLAGDDSSFVTGEVLHVCGGLQLAPLP